MAVSVPYIVAIEYPHNGYPSLTLNPNRHSFVSTLELPPTGSPRTASNSVGLCFAGILYQTVHNKPRISHAPGSQEGALA